MSWASRVATGFLSRSSQDPRWAMGFDNVNFPLQVRPRCLSLLFVEPCFQSNLYLPSLYKCNPIFVLLALRGWMDFLSPLSVRRNREELQLRVCLVSLHVVAACPQSLCVMQITHCNSGGGEPANSSTGPIRHCHSSDSPLCQTLCTPASSTCKLAQRERAVCASQGYGASVMKQRQRFLSDFWTDTLQLLERLLIMHKGGGNARRRA